MKPTIFVTGATGHVGSQILTRLDADLFAIRAGARHPEGANLPRGVKGVSFDYDDDRSVREAFAGVDRLYMMAPVEVRFTERMQRMLRVAKEAGVSRIVHQSQFNADAKPGMQGTWWHTEMEQATKSSGIPFEILRPNAFMVNVITRYAEDIRKRNQIVAPAGDSKVSFIDPADIGACAAKLLMRESVASGTWSITGPESLSFADLASRLTEVLGRRISYSALTDDEFRDEARKLNIPEIAVQLTLDGYMLEKLGFYSAITSTVEELVGRPAICFRDWATTNTNAFAVPSSPDLQEAKR